MRELTYFHVCRALGWLLRSARYSSARIVYLNGLRQVQKSRSFYAPVLLWPGNALLRVLDTGVRVLRNRDWHERESQIYRSLYGTSVRVDVDGTLILPCLAGETLATLLEDPALQEPIRKEAIECAAVALAELHRRGFTHGDAMAENVLVDLASRPCGARWFDFETVHDSHLPLEWRRADDVRALLTTCLLRTEPERVAETLQLILDAYADEEVSRLLETSFSSMLRRPLTFHLAQAGLSIRCFREIARLLRVRVVGQDL
jgi:tRNA A-37 threonylcarbamoyl transferase component Bud32